MHKINWQPGEQGKGIVDAHGVVHAFNEDEYGYHHDFLADNPHINPISYFYVNPEGGIHITYPHPEYDGKTTHDEMMERILPADPAFHPDLDDDWAFG